MRIRLDTSEAKQTLQKNFAVVRKRIEQATVAAANMAASMIEKAAREDIASSGNFGGRWTSGLHVAVEGSGNMMISMTHDIPYAGIFEEGGTIQGHPLLWIGLSGTDAAGVAPKDYGDQLFSANSSRPLLFSMSDKKPKFFGVASVTIPPKWRLREIQLSVMQNFRDIFASAFNAAR